MTKHDKYGAYGSSYEGLQVLMFRVCGEFTFEYSINLYAKESGHKLNLFLLLSLKAIYLKHTTFKDMNTDNVCIC